MVFKPGTVVVWDPSGFNPEYWNKLSESDRVRFYGALGYGAEKQRLFVYLCEILDADGSSGHCCLVELGGDGHIEYMRHTTEFRPATGEEF